ncbi:hypothetical protein [Tessaracoccus sp. OH4464_COT-324]|uniref:hypothetical protein n=1 Tax=Tessaracoccus sp. OH4464_COT-324 TaxID=2491059 RepID=UPI000F6382BF|nr:hypothetical protein [Tessaracoccus sp. OH4464_COT-324]RRD43961.1 hypothetical protein EII42_12055 [Tessaracoccus sp. OH4464_COT-324]
MAGPEDAGSLFQRLKDLVNQLLPKDRPTPPPAGPGSEGPAAWEGLPEKMAEVSALVARVKEEDRIKSDRMIEQDHANLPNASPYQGELLARLIEANASVCEAADVALEVLTAVIDGFIEHLNVPARLKAELNQLQKAAESAQDIAESLPSMEKVPGWSGPAADEYTEMAGVQTQASQEMLGLFQVLLKAHGTAIEVNEAMLAAGYEYLCQVVERFEADSYVVSCTEHYAATKRLTQLLDNAFLELRSLQDLLANTEQRMSEDLVAAQNAPRVLVNFIWPHGTAKAGIKAGDIPGMRATPPMDTLDELDDPDARGNQRGDQ